MQRLLEEEGASQLHSQPSQQTQNLHSPEAPDKGGEEVFGEEDKDELDDSSEESSAYGSDKEATKDGEVGGTDVKVKPESEAAPAKPLGPMELCCIEGCTRQHSNHVFHGNVGALRPPPNSMRMCRAHYIEGLGECCIKGCPNKATNRNWKPGLGHTLKDGIEPPYKVCMLHWNIITADYEKKSKKKIKDKKSKKKKKKKKAVPTKQGKPKKKKGTGEEEMAFLESVLGSMLSEPSDEESDSSTETSRSDSENEAKPKDVKPVRGPVTASNVGSDWVAVKTEGGSSLAASDENSSENEADGVRKRKIVGGSSLKKAASTDIRPRKRKGRTEETAGTKPKPRTGAGPSGSGVANGTEKRLRTEAMNGTAEAEGEAEGRTSTQLHREGGSSLAQSPTHTPAQASGRGAAQKSPSGDAATSTLARKGVAPQLNGGGGDELETIIRAELGEMRDTIFELKRFVHERMEEQLSMMKTECMELIKTALSQAHEREMVQLNLLRHNGPTSVSGSPTLSTSSVTTSPTADRKSVV